MKPAWRWNTLEEGGEKWPEFLSRSFTFDIGLHADGRWQGSYLDLSGGEIACGPKRKTIQAAHNDCRRFAAKLRGELVVFGRSKLP